VLAAEAKRLPGLLSLRQGVCDEAADWVRAKGWSVLGIERSPITGPEGNVEFLLGAVKAPLANG